MQCNLRAQKSCTFTFSHSRFPALPFMHWDFSGFPESFHNIMNGIVGERPKLFVNLHCEMWSLICLTLYSWHLAQSGFADKDRDAPYITKHEPLTYYQFTCLLWAVSKHFYLAPVPNNLECLAAINIKMCLYLQNTFKLVSKTLEILYLYFCQLNTN